MKILLTLLILLPIPFSLFSTQMQEICGRNGKPTYRARIQDRWNHTELVSSKDTTKPICELFISETNSPEKIRITIHNFPTESSSERIPSEAHILRWKRQFQWIDPISISSSPQCYCGYFGSRFEASGRIGEKSCTMIAWAMMISPDHYSTLSLQQHYQPEKKDHFHQMSADYTIKAVGPPELMAIHREEIIHFANSFELIDEIPSSL